MHHSVLNGSIRSSHRDGGSDSLFPRGETALALQDRKVRLKTAVEPPKVCETGLVRQNPSVMAGKPGRPKGSGFQDRRAVDRHIEHVREVGAKQACPIAAACWSPATPRIEMGSPRQHRRSSAPKSLRLNRVTSGSIERGTPKQIEKFFIPAVFWIFNSRVRAALVTSVAWQLAAGQTPDAANYRRCRRQSHRFSGGVGRPALRRAASQLGGREIGIEQQARSCRTTELLDPRFLQLARSALRCGDPARRSRYRWDGRCCGPRSSWFRADW